MRKDYAHQDLTEYDFSDMDLSGADFSHTILKRANFSSTRLDNADFCFADMSQVQLNEHLHVEASALHPNGALLATSGGSDDDRIRLWDIQQERPIHALYGHLEAPNKLLFHPSGQWLASTSSDGTIRIWDVAHHGESGRQVHLLRVESTYSALPMAFSPDGRWFAYASRLSGICLLEVAQWQQVLHIQTPQFPTGALAFSSDGRLLAEGAGSTIRLWQTTDGQAQSEIQTPETVKTLLFHPSSPQHLFVQGNTHVRLVNIAEKNIVGSTEQSSREAKPRPGVITFTGPDDLLAIGLSYEAIELWDLAAHRLHTTIKVPRESFVDLYPHPSGRLLLVSQSGICILLDPKTGDEHRIHWYLSCQGANIFGTQGLSSRDRALLLAQGAHETDPATLEKPSPTRPASSRPLEDLSMPEHKITGGYSKAQDRYYDLFVSIKRDGRVCLRESYEYPARDGVEEREYGYSLFIPAPFVDTFLAHLANLARIENLPSFDHTQEALVQLLTSLVRQGILASTETARAKANFYTFKSWLHETSIPYKQSTWVWVS